MEQYYKVISGALLTVSLAGLYLIILCYYVQDTATDIQKLPLHSHVFKRFYSLLNLISNTSLSQEKSRIYSIIKTGLLIYFAYPIFFQYSDIYLLIRYFKLCPLLQSLRAQAG